MINIMHFKCNMRYTTIVGHYWFTIMHILVSKYFKCRAIIAMTGKQ